MTVLAGSLHAGLFDQAAKSLEESTGESLASAQESVAQASAAQKMAAGIIDASKKLESSLSGNPELQSLLTNAMESLAQRQDLAALQDLNALAGAKLTDDQKSLVNGLRSDVEVLALKRQLPESGPVTKATQALQAGDTETAQAQLDQVMESGTLSEPQTELVKTIMGNLGGAAK